MEKKPDSKALKDLLEEAPYTFHFELKSPTRPIEIWIHCGEPTDALTIAGAVSFILAQVLHVSTEVTIA
jgi:hypothetical protein